MVLRVKIQAECLAYSSVTTLCRHSTQCGAGMPFTDCRPVSTHVRMSYVLNSYLLTYLLTLYSVMFMPSSILHGLCQQTMDSLTEVSAYLSNHYAIWGEAGSKLVADRFETGRRPPSNLSATSFEPDSVMEFCFEPVCDQLRTSFEPASVMEFGFNFQVSAMNDVFCA